MTQMKKAAFPSRPKCPQCGLLLVPASGPLNAKIGIMPEFPGWEEKKQGLPLVGETGKIAQAEFGKLGIALHECRISNLWGHDPVEDEKELGWHMAQAIRALKKCKLILLMGSEVTQALLGSNVSDLYGLKVECEFFPDSVIMVSPNPAIALHSTVGELRLSIQKFYKEAKRLKLC